MSSTSRYDAYYYEHGCGKPYERNNEWLSFFDSIAKRIVDEIAPSSVLDVGCALGLLVETLRGRGVEAYGIDISEFAIANTHESIKPYCQVGSILEPYPQKYDLIITIEVLEHLPRRDAEKAIENLCKYTDDILFSSSPVDFKETTHLNVQPTEYWTELFARNGFYRDVDFDTSFITSWAVRFRRSKEPFHRIVRNYDRVMQRLVEEKISLRDLNLSQMNLLAERDGQIESLRNHIERIYASPTYKLVEKIQKLIPPGSRRKKIISKIFNIS